MTENKELEKTKSLLAQELYRICEVLISNIQLCDTVKGNNKKLNKENDHEYEKSRIFNTFQTLLIDMMVLDSLIMTGLVLKLAKNEINDIRSIKNISLLYNNYIGWFLDRLETFNRDEIDYTLDEIKHKTEDVFKNFLSNIDFKWFDKKKMMIEVIDELKYGYDFD